MFNIIEVYQVRLIHKPEVLDKVGVTYSTIWTWMRRGQFPRARVVGGKSAWVEDEIEAWLKQLPVRRLKGDPVERETN